MRTLLITLFSIALCAAPLSASALGFSFGGRVVAVVPCSGGMRHVTIAPAGAFPVTYIWTPATITYSAGRPRLPGQQILGVADVPFVCFIGGGGIFSSPVPLYGFRMQTVGTSGLGAGLSSGLGSFLPGGGSFGGGGAGVSF